MIKNKYIALALFVLVIFPVFSQDTSILWQRTIGGSEMEQFPHILETDDGGLLLGGTSSSNISGEKMEDSRGGEDFWILKLDSSGGIEWQRTIGGSGNDKLQSVSKTIDGNYLIGGSSDSPISGEKSEASRGLSDYWFLKIGAAGNIIWQKTLGGSDYDFLTTIKELNDGGFILYGMSGSSISGDRTVNQTNGDPDLWMIKLHADLSISFQKSLGFGGSFGHSATDLDLVNESGYIISGVFGTNSSQEAYYISLINSNGLKIWDELYGGNSFEFAPFVFSTNENNFIVAGTSSSNISGNKTEDSEGGFDFWILELNENGEINWQNTIGGTGGEQPWAVFQTQDGNYIVSGNSDSPISGDKTEDAKGNSSDFWIIKLNNEGIILWQNTIGGDSVDHHARIIESVNENYYICGSSRSNISFDKVEDSRGEDDFWILKLDSTLGLQESELFKNFTFYPNPAKNRLELLVKDIRIDSVKLFSAKGALIQIVEGFIGNKTIDISQLSSGVYFLQIAGNNKVVTKKFIKE